MKKLLLIILTLLALTGCEKEEYTINNDDNIYYKDFGSYELPENWIESTEYSTSNKFFYILEGYERDAQPDNISINRGTNKYSAEDHETFRKAILAQISMQTAGIEGVKINATGSTTDNDYVVYTFTITGAEENMTTTQYYIVGDYEYILVHETVFGESSEETDDAAKSIVNSFKWN